MYISIEQMEMLQKVENILTIEGHKEANDMKKLNSEITEWREKYRARRRNSMKKWRDEKNENQNCTK